MTSGKELAASIGRFAATPALVIVTFTIFAFFDFTGWPVELFSHFRLQYAICLALAIPFQCCVKLNRTERLYLLVSIAAFLTNIGVVAMATTGGVSAATGTHKVSLLQFNVNSSNTNYPVFNQLVERLQPDILCIEEVSDGWKSNFDQLKKIYPYQSVRPRSDNFGIAILSKFEIKDAKLEALSKAGVPTIFANIKTPGQNLQIIATHTMPPVSPEATNDRDEHLRALANRIASRGMPTIIAGDFNASPYTYIFRDFVKDSGLVDSRLNKGIENSWPTMFFWLLTPIDHILSSRAVSCTERHVEGASGSDHYPVYARFVY